MLDGLDPGMERGEIENKVDYLPPDDETLLALPEDNDGLLDKAWRVGSQICQKIRRSGTEVTEGKFHSMARQVIGGTTPPVLVRTDEMPLRTLVGYWSDGIRLVGVSVDGEWYEKFREEASELEFVDPDEATRHVIEKSLECILGNEDTDG